MQKILGNKTVINSIIRRNVTFYIFDFHVRLKTWSSDAENSTFSLQKYVFFLYYILKYI